MDSTNIDEEMQGLNRQQSLMSRQMTPGLVLLQNPSPPMIKQTTVTLADEQQLEEEDPFAMVGLEAPSHLNTSFRRWASLVLVAATGALASGPCWSWPTLEPLLIDQGLWAGPGQQQKLTSVYSIATGVGVSSWLVTGVFYDSLGARSLGVWGAVGCAIAVFGMALAVMVPALNDLMWVAYPTAMVLGGANSLDAYAWLWLLPGNQATVAAFVGAIQCLADSFVLVGVLMHAWLGLAIQYYFMLIGILSLMTGAIAYAVIPSRRDMQLISGAVLATQAPAEVTTNSYGATDDAANASPKAGNIEAEDGESLSDVMCKSWLAIKDAATLCYRVHPTAFSLIVFYQVAQYMFTMYPSFYMYPLYKDLLGRARATILVDTFGGIYAVVGAACLLVFGKMVDRIGLSQTVMWLNIPTLVNTVLYAIPTYSSEITAQVLLTWISNAWYVVCPIFCTSYGPPELFGSLQGLLAGLLGISQLLLTRVGTFLCEKVAADLNQSHAFAILLAIDMWSFLTILGGTVLVLWWWYNPLPATGSTTLVDIQEAREAAANGTDYTVNTQADGSEKLKLSKVGKKKLKQTGTCCSCLPKLSRQSEP